MHAKFFKVLALSVCFSCTILGEAYSASLEEQFKSQGKQNTNVDDDALRYFKELERENSYVAENGRLFIISWKPPLGFQKPDVETGGKYFGVFLIDKYLFGFASGIWPSRPLKYGCGFSDPVNARVLALAEGSSEAKFNFKADQDRRLFVKNSQVSYEFEVNFEKKSCFSKRENSRVRTCFIIDQPTTNFGWNLSQAYKDLQRSLVLRPNLVRSCTNKKTLIQ